MKEGYLSAVAEFFEVSRNEVGILHDWRLPPDEVPVALFVAERAGVSPEAPVALWRAGGRWGEIIERFGLGVESLHVPLPQGAPAGALARVYDELGATPLKDWGRIELTHEEVVAFVNLRVLSGIAEAAPAEVLARFGGGASYVDIYGELVAR